MNDRRKHLKATKKETSPQDVAMNDAVSLQQQGRGEILSDVLGSWTGTPYNKNEVPEQDADDL